MGKVSIYLNFEGNAEEAFHYYKSVFNTEFASPIMKMGDLPPQDGMPSLPDHEKSRVMHVSLPIMDGTLLMGTDILESMGHKKRENNCMTISLEIDTKEEADKLYSALSINGTNLQEMADQFWGAYWGCCKDRFGVSWMFNYTYKK